jgi:tetratricopeptide (TPR) repeat protein
VRRRAAPNAATAAAAAIALGAAALAVGLAAPARAGDPIPRRMTSTCVQDDPVPTPPNYVGWERSSVLAWEALETQGGIVPDIEEDRSHAPPAWWRYPSPLRSAELLAAEAKDPKGLYTRVAPGDLKSGDVIVRVQGAGACGRMAVVAGLSQDVWMTIEPAPAGGSPPKPSAPASPPAKLPGGVPPPPTSDETDTIKQSGNPLFFDGKNLRPEAAAYRVSVKKDSTLGHVREPERDLAHLERTIAERPPLIARKGRTVVDDKVHDLVDEAVSLAADPAFEEARRRLTGRSLALAAALDWPGAPEAAQAVLDDALRRGSAQPDAALARASLYLLAGEADKAAELAESATAIPGVSARVHYIAGRALLAAGKSSAGLAALKRYAAEDPGDPRAKKLLETGGREPALAPPPPSPTDGELRFSATPERASLHSRSYDFDVSWPLSWRVVAQTAAPGAGVIVEFSTGRVMREDGEVERATASLLVQKPEAGAAAALARKGARNIFPDAKLKSLPPLVPGSRREQFRERAQGAAHQGEVTTLERNGAVFFLVLNASPASYPKLKDEYAAFVKSLGPPPSTSAKK